jgi:hypothetical protein
MKIQFPLLQNHAGESGGATRATAGAVQGSARLGVSVDWNKSLTSGMDARSSHSAGTGSRHSEPRRRAAFLDPFPEFPLARGQRSRLDLCVLAVLFETSSPTRLAELLNLLTPRTFVGGDYVLVAARPVWLASNPVDVSDRTPAAGAFSYASASLDLTMWQADFHAYLQYKIDCCCKESAESAFVVCRLFVRR